MVLKRLDDDQRQSVDRFRTFIAIELPSDLRTRIAEHAEALRRKLPHVRASWTRAENIHLTLKFLGDIPVVDIPKLSGAVEASAGTIGRFDLVVSGCGAFPPHGQPKVLWIGVSSSASSVTPSPLTALHAAIELECDREGFPREARPFHPHLTIARLRSASGARELARLHAQLGFDAYTVNVGEVRVMRSELSSRGSLYTELSRHKLLELR